MYDFSEREEIIKSVLAPYETDSAAASDEHFMKAALALARRAASDGEVPVGCVIVRDGKILTGDYNGRETPCTTPKAPLYAVHLLFSADGDSPDAHCMSPLSRARCVRELYGRQGYPVS